MISQLKNFDILVNKFFNILICLFIVFKLNLSVILARIFPQTELKAQPPPLSAQVIEFVKSIGRYPY